MREEWTDFWGKIDRETGDSLSLVDHSADVAACTVALLQHTLLGRRLARLGGLPDLHPGQIARLGFLAACHDLGKAGVRFQRKVFPGVRERAGHVLEALQLLNLGGGDFPLAKPFDRLFPFDEYASWGDEEALMGLLVATICHHGRPYPTPNDGPRKADWQARLGVDPFLGLKELISAARGWFPDAFAPEVPPLPSAPAFQHAWNGVLNLADWLGSSREFFPFETPKADGNRFSFSRHKAREALRWIGLDTTASRSFLGAPSPLFRQISNKDAPRQAQARLAELPLEEQGSVAVLEASTGTGKTEAALWRFARLFHAGQVDGLYFALPTRTAATQIYGRVHKAVERLFAGLPETQRPPVVLAVPGYLRVDGKEGIRLPEFEVKWDDEDPAFRCRAWAGEHTKRYLAGAVVVGTVDQVLLSALAIRHSHLRASCLLRHLLVVDEVHASDAYMTRVLEEVLTHHRAAGGHALLLSATLGATARHRLLAPRSRRPSLKEALAVPYPVIHQQPAVGGETLAVTVEPGPAKAVLIELTPIAADPAAVATRALAAAVAGARVLVVRNTVGDCRAVQQSLEELAQSQGREDLLFTVPRGEGRVPAPHHGRFAPEDRKLLDRAIERAFEPDRERDPKGCVAVATQTVEQSLDLDADLLITDLAPMDVLLQRIGRLHRHDLPRPPGFEEPRVIVVTPENRDLTERVRQDGETSGKHGLGGKVYDDLRVIEATWRQLEKRQHLEIPRQCRELVELTTHPEALRDLGDSGSSWSLHGQRVTGSQLAHRNQGKLNLFKWDEAFGTSGLSDLTQEIQTRLGERDLILRLPTSPEGPFGLPVPQLTLRLWEATSQSDFEGEPRADDLETLSGGGFRFSFNGKNFLYDRLGVAKREVSR